MNLKKRCLELALALASFLPLNANSQELKFERENYGNTQDLERFEAL